VQQYRELFSVSGKSTSKLHLKRVSSSAMKVSLEPDSR
jgi:hypothetical protein